MCGTNFEDLKRGAVMNWLKARLYANNGEVLVGRLTLWKRWIPNSSFEVTAPFPFVPRPKPPSPNRKRESFLPVLSPEQ